MRHQADWPWREPLAWALLALALRLWTPLLLVDGGACPEQAGPAARVSADHVLATDGLAGSLVSGRGAPWVAHPPLWPRVLSGLRESGLPFDQALSFFGATCGALTVVLAGCLALAWFGLVAARAAACVTACWPAFAIHDANGTSAALLAALVLAAVFLAARVIRAPAARGALAWSAGVGVVLALATLTRTSMALSALALLAWLAWSGRRCRLAALVSGVVFAAVLAPLAASAGGALVPVSVGQAAHGGWPALSPWWTPEHVLPVQGALLASYTPVAALALLAGWRHRARFAVFAPVPILLAVHVLLAAAGLGDSASRALLDPLLIVLAASLAPEALTPDPVRVLPLQGGALPSGRPPQPA